MRLLKLVLLFGCLTSNSLFAQTNFSDFEAINIFKKYPPKYGFEGVYDIYYRSTFKINGSVTDAVIEEEKFKSDNYKFCLYTTPNGIYGRVVDLRPDSYNYSFYNGWLQKAQFKVDLYGIFTYHYFRTIIENKESDIAVSKIYEKDGTLFWDFVRSIIKNDGFTDLRVQFLLEKIYHP